jgi:saccharopine dehydrogenase-like NADP-dependent oxidoreductase
MKYTYGVLGGGRQGTAAAYDMVKLGDAKALRIADVDRAAARACADRVNRMLQTDVARGVTPRGVKPVEIAVPVEPFVTELRRRGFALTEQVTFR